MQLSITLEGHFGLTWAKWQRLTTAIEAMGFAGIYRSDHFAQPNPPDADALEAMISLAYLATHSRSVHFGTLVAPLSFRDPVMLARQAMAIDDLSGGRMILGVGAGWMEREHTMFGYPLGDITTRLDRLAEGVAVIAALMHSAEPVTFAGKFYQLQDAQLLPRPQRPTPLMISAERFGVLSRQLDDLLRVVGRPSTAVKRTIMLPVLCWRNDDEREQLVQGIRRASSRMAPLKTEEIIAFFHQHLAAITGDPDQVTEQIHAYVHAGVEEMICQWILLDDQLGLEILGKEVLPKVMKR